MGTQNSAGTIKWLGGFGSSDKGDQVSLNHTATALRDLAEFLIDTATRNLQKGGNVATGETASSMQIVNVKTNAARLSMDVEILSTYKFLDKGVRGTESGAGKYAFKTKYPNKKMATEILKWVRKRSIVSKYSPHSSRQDNLRGAAVETKNKEIKNLKDRATNYKSLAYAISTNIKKHGIKKTGFFTNAVAATLKEQKARYARAFKLDVIENLKISHGLSN